jgi:hypothetical protein
MFGLQYNHTATLCLITFELDGNRRLVSNNQQSIDEAKAFMLRRFLLAYLNHRYQTYKHVGRSAECCQITMAINGIQSCGVVYTLLRGWLARNADFLIAIKPKKENVWNKKINKLIQPPR